MDSKDKRTQKNKHFVTSVEFSIQGIKTVFKEEKNMKIHVFLACCAVLLGLFLRLTSNEWLWLLLAIFFVLIVEMINTVFENVVDMFTDFHFHPIGKKIKDMAAGAVFLAACFALLVGAILFLPKIWHLLIS